MMILVAIQRLIGAPLARVGKTQESRLKSQEESIKSHESLKTHEQSLAKRSHLLFRTYMILVSKDIYKDVYSSNNGVEAW